MLFLVMACGFKSYLKLLKILIRKLACQFIRIWMKITRVFPGENICRHYALVYRRNQVSKVEKAVNILCYQRAHRLSGLPGTAGIMRRQ